MQRAGKVFTLSAAAGAIATAAAGAAEDAMKHFTK